MTWSEMFYKLAEFFWSDIWHYAGLLIFIAMIKGDIAKVFYSVRGFIQKVKYRYQQKQGQLAAERFKNRNKGTEAKDEQ